MNKKIWRNLTVLVVIALVVLGGFLFNKARQSSIPDESRIAAPAPEQESQKEMNLSEKEVKEKIEKDKEYRKESLVQELIQGITGEVEVSPEEIRKLYKEK